MSVLPLTGEGGSNDVEDAISEEEFFAMQEFLVQQPRLVLRRIEDLSICDETAYEWSHTLHVELSPLQKESIPDGRLFLSVGLFPKVRLPDLAVRDESDCLVPILSRQERVTLLARAFIEWFVASYLETLTTGHEIDHAGALASEAAELLSRLYVLIYFAIDAQEPEIIERFEEFQMWVAWKRLMILLSLPLVESPASVAELTVLAGVLPRVFNDSILRTRIHDLGRATQILVQLPATEAAVRVLRVTFSDHITYANRIDEVALSTTEDEQPRYENSPSWLVKTLFHWTQPTLDGWRRGQAIRAWCGGALLESLLRVGFLLERFSSALGLVPQIMEFGSANALHTRSYYALLDRPDGSDMVRCYWAAAASKPPPNPRAASAKQILSAEEVESDLDRAGSSALFELQIARRDTKFTAILCLAAAVISVLLLRHPLGFQKAEAANITAVVVLIPGAVSGLIAQRSAPFSLWLARWLRMLLSAVGLASVAEGVFLAIPSASLDGIRAISGVALALELFTGIVLMTIGYGPRFASVREHGFFRHRIERICREPITKAKHRQRWVAFVTVFLALSLGIGGPLVCYLYGGI